MSGKTISIAKGKGSIQHNNRKFETPNIDCSRVKDNIIYVKQDIKEAYQQIFGKSVEEYNARQKKKCRRINDYYEKIRQSKNGEELFHEVVVQVGDMTDSGYGTDDFNKCRQVLDNYMRDFIERNSHIHVFNAVMHLDEQTPHLHISFIPIGEGYKTGMNVRNSLNKSMEAYSVGDKVGILGWYERERAVLTECANRYGIEITQKNERRERLSVSEYKKTMREVERLTEAKNNLKNDIKELEHKKIESIEQKKELEELSPKKRLGYVSIEDYEELKKVAENYQSKLKLIEVENKELKQEVAENKANQQRAAKEVKELKQELFEIKQTNKELVKGREDFEKSVKSDYDLKFQHAQQDLAIEKFELGKKIANLTMDVEFEKQMNRGLVKRLEEAMEEKKTLIERVMNEWKVKYEELDNTWKEKYSKLENAFNEMKQKFDDYRQKAMNVLDWRNEFLKKHNLLEKWKIFSNEKIEDKVMREKFEKETKEKYHYHSDEFIESEVNRKMEMFKKAREEDRRLEKLKVDDPQAYEQEMFARAELERINALRFGQSKSRGQSLGR